MNEPLFTLDTGPDGTRRRFAGPRPTPPVRVPEGQPPLRPAPGGPPPRSATRGRTPPGRGPKDGPPLQPLRARLRAGTLAIAAGAFRSRLKLRT